MDLERIDRRRALPLVAALGACGWARPAAAAAASTAAKAAPKAGAAPRTHTIVIEGLRFMPPTLAVQSGDSVVWQNKDLVPHTATAAGAFDSGNIAPGASWKHTLTRTGTLPYVCTFHPTMRATLEVR